MKINIQSLHFSADKKLVDLIDKRLSKLEQYFDRIIEANVSLKLENSGQIKDKIVEVRLSIPGTVLYAKEKSKSFEAGLDTTTNALKRQLIRYKDQARARSSR